MSVSRFGIATFVLVASSILCCSSVSYAENAIPEISNVGQILSYQNSEGQNYFALRLKADRLPAAAHSGKQIAILFDTSASQVGEHRIQALDVLKSLLSELPNDSTVAVYAVDVQCTPFVNEFVTPQSRQAKLAVESLASRAPLGATNLAQALKTVMQGLQNEKARSIIYIGDGMSSAQLISIPEMAGLTQQLAHQHVPVHSYAVGPRKDLRLLGTLGVYTGGIILTDLAEGKKDLPAKVGRELAKAIQAPVFYPEKIQLSDKKLELNTPQALPIRTDRETIYLAEGELTGRLSLELSNKNLNGIWKFNVPVAQAVNSFLAVPWVNYQPGQEIGIAFAGQRMMHLARTGHEEHMAQLEFAGTQAIRSGNFEQAAKFGNLIQQLDPGNTRGNSLLKMSDKFKQDQLAQADTKQPATAAQTQPDAKPAAKGDAKPPIDDSISKVEQLRQIKGAQMKIEVSNTIEDAQRISAENPDGALGMLKRTLNFVKSTSDIDIDLQQQLERRLNSMMVEVRSQIEVAETRRIRQQQQLAQLEQQKRLIDKILLEDEKLEQLIDRVRSLIQDGRHGDSEAYEEAEAVSRVAVDMEPGNGPATAALFTSEAAGQLDKVFRMRSLRADRFLATLYQVELSHVPFPDEPPIRWPAAPVWVSLTERRKKWAAVDLHKNSPAEQRIFSELQKETDANFPDIPLSEVMTYFAELHNITILINSNDLGEEGLTPDEPVNVSLSGIKLKSALNIILKPIGLTYVVEDEVMKITTIVKSDEIYVTRVYPVADLVISVATQQQSVGSSQGGFGGQQGGGQQGGIGGGGGFGGGQQGGQGGGQGFFNIGPEMLMMNAPQAQKGKQPNKNAKANPAKEVVKPIDDQEMKGILDGILSQADSKQPKAQFQVEDNPFQFDNRTIEQLKKKPEIVK